jgi:hypothetical protein
VDRKKDLLHNIKPQYFWDVDFACLDADKSRRLIIERIFSLGTSKEIMGIINYYGEKTVIDVLTHLNYLDSRTLNLASKLFNVPLASFKCYTRRQSKSEFWIS